MPLRPRTLVAIAAAVVVVAAPALAGAQEPTPTDPTSTTAPPIGEEDPSTTIPPSDATVPPQDQDPTQPLQGVAVPLDLAKAQAGLTDAENALAAAVAQRMALEAQVTALNQQIAAMAAAEQQAIIDLAAATAQIKRRAVRAYVHGTEDPVKLVGESFGDEIEYEQRLSLMGSVLESDQKAIERYREAKQKASDSQAVAAAQIASLADALNQANLEEAKASANVTDAQFVLGVAQIGGTLAIHGFVFPVKPPYSFRNDYGDPRMPGTEQAHTHRGNDIIAAEGQELLACERGVITQLLEGGLGGTGIFLKGASGTVYYYAHLSAYAPGLHVGQAVEANELVGYVGHTGDAQGPHLHFEIHPKGGEPINPYPILVAADPTNSHPPVQTG